MDGNHGELHPKTSDFVESGIPFVMASDLKDGHVDTTGCAFISEELARTLRKGFAIPGDVLISHKATMGRTAIVGDIPAPFIMLTPQVTYYRVKDPARLLPRYLKYYFDSPDFQNLLSNWSNKGSTRAYLGITAQLDLPVHLPSQQHQKAVVDVLEALDDKIELNRKMNETLEQVAQAIFKSWFIDFDGHTEFQDSPLGPIPKGWKVTSLAQAGKWVSGGTPDKSTSAYWDGDIPWFSAKSMGPLWLHRSDRRLTPSGAKAGSRLVPRRTVLFIVRGMSLANEWRIGITSREATLNQDLKGIVDNGSLVPELLLAWLLVKQETIRARADEAGHGTKRLPTEVLHSFALAVPERREQEVLARPCQAVFAKIENNLAESETLAELRDTLLPKLISGEIRIKGAEKTVGEAT